MKNTNEDDRPADELRGIRPEQDPVSSLGNVAPADDSEAARATIEWAAAEIAAAYDELGHQLDWRFLTTRARTFNRSTEIVLMTLNPGGRQVESNHPRVSSEAGSSYIIESWKGKPPGKAQLQLQIRRLFAELASARGLKCSGDDLLNQVLSAQFIPFRSPTFDDLTKQADSVAFSRRLWRSLSASLDPRLIITIDTMTAKEMRAMMAPKWSDPHGVEKFKTGWGSIEAELWRWGESGTGRAIVRFPHLSRFGIFGREKGQAEITHLLEATAQHCWG